ALQPEDQYAAIIVFGAWQADGIRTIPSCYACEGVWEGLYRIWNPDTNTVSAPVEPFDIFMTRLPGTGEILKSVAHSAYPQNGGPAAYFPLANVVEYYADIYETEGQLIYFNPDNPYVENAEWVADGQAIAIRIGGTPTSQVDNPMGTKDNSAAYLLFRDGHQVNIHPDLGSILIGTPDGWIARNGLNGSAALVTLNANEVVATALGTHPEWEVAGTNFTLGTNAAPEPFPPAAPPERVTCPGFVDSRLWPNTFARITPGDSNNLRAEATTSSALIGKIPGGEAVAVLFGPVCGENMTWWQVEYLGQTGWTVEGQGSNYWMEPISDNFF
ncbi:MAG TPA: SH3 domain-containing protein, partial [Phototrophicaceae bacterium]|nr:SH3 domain-containing protein [Phototrophicaceae bacterium]